MLMSPETRIIETVSPGRSEVFQSGASVVDLNAAVAPPCTRCRPEFLKMLLKYGSVPGFAPATISGAPIGCISNDCCAGMPVPARYSPGTSTEASCGGVDLSSSLISSMFSIGVMPQMGSAENSPKRNATAPISLPSM